MLIGAYFHTVDIPIGHPNTHLYRPAADFAIDHKLGAAFRLIEGQGKRLPTMRAIDGQGVVHGSTVRASARKGNLAGTLSSLI